ncbi:MAG: MFS transporter [Bacteroidales bacterium]|nr:MFS transporter [Bacteroidales bacterium]
MNTTRTNSFRSVPVFLAFLCMGFGDAVGPFVGLAKEHFQLSNFMATLIQFVGFMMFFIVSIPMGIYQDKKNKKHVLGLGLIVALIGLVIPIFKGLESYAFFLLTVLLLGGGAAILQVAGNPIMRDVSPEGKYSRNLSFGQFVKAIGSLSGPIIPVIAARWLGAGWEVVFPIYSIALLITLVILSVTKIDEKKEEGASPVTFASSFNLLGNGYVAMMVLGIFIYVGAEQCMSSGIPLLLNEKFGIDIESLGVAGTGLFFFALMIGRFLGGLILNRMSAKSFLVTTVLFSFLGIIGLLAGPQAIVVVSILLIGLGFANIFPLIFSIAVDRMPERTNELSGLMVTAIVGGAILPLIMGKLADVSNITIGLLVPLAGMLYIAYVALRTVKIK